MGVPHNLRKPKGKLKICLLLFLIILVILSHAWLFLEAWLTASKCLYGAAVSHKEWNAAVRAVPRWQVWGNQANMKHFVFASNFCFMLANMRSLTLLVFYGSRESWWGARRGEEGLLPNSKIGESWSWEKNNKLNLTATAVLMNGWEDSKGRHVFISQSW